jgi:hypothetical protein
MTEDSISMQRTHCTITMHPKLHKALKARCAEEDTPLSVFVRNLIKAELARHERAKNA